MTSNPFSLSHGIAPDVADALAFGGAGLADLGARIRQIPLAAIETVGGRPALLSDVSLGLTDPAAVQADSSGLDGSARHQIATEVDELINEALQVANTSHGGRRIFGGFQSGVPPFVPDVAVSPASVAYQGDAGGVMRAIGDGEEIAVNLDGDALFDGVFTSLIAFRDALRSNDRPAINSAAVAIGQEIEGALQARGEIGARMRRLDLVMDRMQDDDFRLRTMVSELEEVDLTAEVVELQMRDMAFQTALSATGRSLNLSLLDYLR